MYDLSDFVKEGHMKQDQILSGTGGLFSLGHFIVLTPCSRVPLKKLIFLELVKEFPAFDRIRRYSTALIAARNLPVL